jgi:alkaline phosphatase D
MESSEHKLPKHASLMPLFLADPPGPDKPDCTFNMLLRHGIRSCLEYAKSFDRARARALSNPDLAPHLQFVDLGGHGYAKVRLSGDEMRTEFVCIPRPIARADGIDGGPLRYRLAHTARLWAPGERPHMTTAVIEAIRASASDGRRRPVTLAAPRCCGGVGGVSVLACVIGSPSPVAQGHPPARDATCTDDPTRCAVPGSWILGGRAAPSREGSLAPRPKRGARVEAGTPRRWCTIGKHGRRRCLPRLDARGRRRGPARAARAGHARRWIPHHAPARRGRRR